LAALTDGLKAAPFKESDLTGASLEQDELSKSRWASEPEPGSIEGRESLDERSLNATASGLSAGKIRKAKEQK